MSGIAVIYKSRYGSAENYAKSIAMTLCADIFNADNVKAEDIKNHNVVIFCGAVYTGSIIGISFLKKNFKTMSAKTIIVIAVGMAEGKEDTVRKLKKDNMPPEMRRRVRFFTLRGLVDYSKLGPFDRFLMFGVVTALKLTRADKSRKEAKDIVDSYKKILDYTDKNSVEPIVELAKSEYLKTL